MLRSASLLLLAVCPAQSPAPAAPAPTPVAASPAQDLVALASRVETSHRPDGPVPKVTALRGVFTLHLLDKGAEQRGQVDLDVQFLEWPRPNSTRVVPLIRYEVRDAGAAVVRGRDREGPWQLVQGQPRDLTAADAKEDLAACERHTNLARQLLQFLSPGEVLRSLQNPGPVQQESLPVRRGLSVACDTVTGDLPAFPLLQQGGEDLPVRLKVYVARADGRLLAVDAWPRVDAAVDTTRGERVLLGDLRARDGILVPHELKHLFREGDGELVLKSSALVVDLSLRPALGLDDFDRTRKPRNPKR